MDKQNKIENATIINGVTLTEQAIHRIKEFQSHDNDGIESAQKGMANAICLISANLDYFDRSEEDLKKVKFVLTDLAIIRDWLGDFKKP